VNTHRSSQSRIAAARAAAALALLAPVAAARAQVLFAETFNDGAAGSRWFNRSGRDGGAADFSTNYAFDYSTLGIPAAPRGTGTIGAKLDVNLTNQGLSSEAEGLNIYPTGKTFSGDFVFRFDVYARVSGGVAPATTEDLLGGVDATGNRANWYSLNGPGTDGVFYGASADGGRNFKQDYTSYVGRPTGDPTAFPLYDNLDPIPQSIFPASNGTPANQWVTFDISQIESNMTWRLNGRAIAMSDGSLGFSSGNVFLGYQDLDNTINPNTFGIFDNVQVLRVTRWTLNNNGTWTTSSNWSAGIPNAVDAIAWFGNAITAPHTVTAPTPQTVGALGFDADFSYTVAGAGTITLDVSVGNASVDVNFGNHTIAAPLLLADDTVFNIAPMDGKLTVSGPFTAGLTGNVKVTKTGFGELQLPSVRAGALKLDAGQVTIAPNGTATAVSRLGSLTIAGTSTSPQAKLDLNDNDLLLDNMPRSQVESWIATARHGGVWDQNGITTSAAASQANHATTLGVLSGAEYHALSGATATFDGLTFTDTAALVKYTWYGDSDFNGKVNFDDYVRIDNGFNNHLTGWLNGDFDLNGTVNFDDYVLIDLAFNTQSGTLGRALNLIGGGGEFVADSSDPSLQLLQWHLTRFGSEYGERFAAAVPEPSALVFAAMASAIGGCSIRGGRCRRTLHRRR
jgi:hypothetical protein